MAMKWALEALKNSVHYDYSHNGHINHGQLF
jgi:hypothetical protein